MSQLTNPFAFTVLGNPLVGDPLPQLRAEGGPLSQDQLGMARDVYRQFADSLRVSQLSFQTQRGELPDGSTYRIMVMPGQKIMQVWPTGDDSEAPIFISGIAGFYPVDPEDDTEYVLVNRGDVNRPTNEWEIVKHPIPKSKLVYLDKRSLTIAQSPGRTYGGVPYLSLDGSSMGARIVAAASGSIVSYTEDTIVSFAQYPSEAITKEYLNGRIALGVSDLIATPLSSSAVAFDGLDLYGTNPVVFCRDGTRCIVAGMTRNMPQHPPLVPLPGPYAPNKKDLCVLLNVASTDTGTQLGVYHLSVVRYRANPMTELLCAVHNGQLIVQKVTHISEVLETTPVIAGYIAPDTFRLYGSMVSFALEVSPVVKVTDIDRYTVIGHVYDEATGEYIEVRFVEYEYTRKETGQKRAVNTRVERDVYSTFTGASEVAEIVAQTTMTHIYDAKNIDRYSASKYHYTTTVDNSRVEYREERLNVTVSVDSSLETNMKVGNKTLVALKQRTTAEVQMHQHYIADKIFPFPAPDAVKDEPLQRASSVDIEYERRDILVYDPANDLLCYRQVVMPEMHVFEYANSSGNSEPFPLIPGGRTTPASTEIIIECRGRTISIACPRETDKGVLLSDVLPNRMLVRSYYDPIDGYQEFYSLGMYDLDDTIFDNACVVYNGKWYCAYTHTMTNVWPTYSYGESRGYTRPFFAGDSRIKYTKTPVTGAGYLEVSIEQAEGEFAIHRFVVDPSGLRPLGDVVNGVADGPWTAYRAV